jgi:hypothetical protein
MHDNDENELTELSGELITFEDITLEDLETRMELALGSISLPSCTCSALQSCGFFCIC